jgi:hypothetical protein
MKYIKQLMATSKFVVTNITRSDVVAAIVLSVVIVAVTVSTSKVVMQNYKLEKSVRIAEQKVTIAQYELDNQRLKNQYYKTDYYLDIAARRQLSRGTDGEKLVIVPRSSIVQYLPTSPDVASSTVRDTAKSSNFAKWGKFLRGQL